MQLGNTGVIKLLQEGVYHCHYGQELQRLLEHYIVFCFISKTGIFVSLSLFFNKNVNPFHAILFFSVYRMIPKINTVIFLIEVVLNS